MQVACSARQHLFFARTCKLSSPAPIFAFRSAAYRACTHIFAGARTRIFTRAACWRAYVLVFLLAWHVGAFEDSKRWDFETKRLTPCCVNDLLEMKRPRHRRGKVVSSHCGPPKTNSFVKNVKSSRTNCFKRWSMCLKYKLYIRVYTFCFALCDLVTILLLKFVKEVVSTMLNLSCRTMSKGLLKLDAIVAAMLIYLSYNSNLVCI